MQAGQPNLQQQLAFVGNLQNKMLNNFAQNTPPAAMAKNPAEY